LDVEGFVALGYDCEEEEAWRHCYVMVVEHDYKYKRNCCQKTLFIP
jgi:hypothetical protein